MNRPAVRIAALTIALLPGLALATEATSPDVAYASIDQLQQRMDAGALDSRQLARALLDRVQRIDRSGVDGSGTRNDGNGSSSFSPVLLDRRRES